MGDGEAGNGVDNGADADDVDGGGDDGGGGVVEDYRGAPSDGGDLTAAAGTAAGRPALAPPPPPPPQHEFDFGPAGTVRWKRGARWPAAFRLPPLES